MEKEAFDEFEREAAGALRISSIGFERRFSVAEVDTDIDGLCW